jgi:hypothetical protein
VASRGKRPGQEFRAFVTQVNTILVGAGDHRRHHHAGPWSPSARPPNWFSGKDWTGRWPSLAIKAMQVSDWGIREGIIAEMLAGAS